MYMYVYIDILYVYIYLYYAEYFYVLNIKYILYSVNCVQIQEMCQHSSAANAFLFFLNYVRDLA